MRNLLITAFVLMVMLLPTSCGFVTPAMVTDTYDIVKEVVFTQDSIEVTIKEKEIYFELQEYQDIDTTLNDGTKIWVHFDRAKNTYLISVFEPSAKLKIKK